MIKEGKNDWKVRLLCVPVLSIWMWFLLEFLVNYINPMQTCPGFYIYVFSIIALIEIGTSSLIIGMIIYACCLKETRKCIIYELKHL